MAIKKVWKAIKVTAGKERQVAKSLEELGIESYAPAMKIKERHQGEWEEVMREILPGYVLLYANWTAELYYTVKDMWYVYYPLSGTVAQAEIDYLRDYELLSCRSEIDYSKGKVSYRGPIAAEPERIVKVDKRKGRALIKFELGDGNEMKRWLPVTIIR